MNKMMNPSQVAANRTARLVREAKTPTYSTATPSKPEAAQALMAKAEDFCGPDFCHVCGRCTDHYGEHSDEQLLAFANSARGKWLMGA